MAESVLCAIGFACCSLCVCLRSTTRGDVFCTPSDGTQIHRVSIVGGRQPWCDGGLYAGSWVGWGVVGFFLEVVGINLATFVITGTDQVHKLGEFGGHILVL